MLDVTFNTPSGLTIRGSRWGNDSAPPVLLGHGGGQTRHAWRQTAELLSKAGWLAVAIDLRGHGDSDWAADGAYQIEAFADDLIAIAGQLPSRPAIVGASLSGLAALIAEGELAPGSFRSLTLVDITPRMDPVGVMKVLGFMHAHEVARASGAHSGAGLTGAIAGIGIRTSFAMSSRRGKSGALNAWRKRRLALAYLYS